MPRVKPLPVSSQEERLADAWYEDASKVADRIAAEEGGPPESSSLGDARAVQLWGMTDAKVDHAKLKAMLMTTGVPEQAAQTLLLAETYPDLLPEYLPRQEGQEPMTDARADQLATLALYPYMAPLVLDFSEDDEERCQRAEHLQREWEKQQMAFQQQAQQTVVGAEMPVAGA